MAEKIKRTRQRQSHATESPSASTAASSNGVECRGDLEEGLAHARSLLENGNLSGARACLSRFGEEWPEAERVARLSRLLTPAAVRLESEKPELSRTEEHQWLREHAHEYPGRWLALLGGKLIAAEQELSTVLDQVRRTARPDDVLLHFVPADATWN